MLVSKVEPLFGGSWNERRREMSLFDFIWDVLRLVPITPIAILPAWLISLCDWCCRCRLIDSGWHYDARPSCSRRSVAHDYLVWISCEFCLHHSLRLPDKLIFRLDILRKWFIFFVGLWMSNVLYNNDIIVMLCLFVLYRISMM